MVVHEANPDRIIALSGGHQPRIVSQLVDGTMQTLKSTEGLQPLLRDIEQYVVLFLQTLKANEARTILDINPDIKKFSKARRLVDLVNENSPSPDRLS